MIREVGSCGHLRNLVGSQKPEWIDVNKRVIKEENRGTEATGKQGKQWSELQLEDVTAGVWTMAGREREKRMKHWKQGTRQEFKTK